MLFNGVFYTLGRMFSYTALGTIFYLGASQFQIARFQDPQSVSCLSVLTWRILGAEMGVARMIGAVTFSVVIGLIMAFIYRKERRTDEYYCSICQTSYVANDVPFLYTGTYPCL